MRRSFYSALLAAFMFCLLWPTTARAQAGTGTITGTATDSSHAILPGATMKLEPGNSSVVSNGQGEFTITGVAPGSYTVTVNYVGFAPFTTSVTVTAGQVARVDAVMAVTSQNDTVVVTAERAHGEAEAINEELTTNNVLDILPLNVINSLPNNNIADAVDRLPGVTLERDEGEGKYVQIRGTEPRLSNVTVDGVEIPSPEGGVRQVKLDVIPADLVESVQIFKTLQANQSGDAIGGTVNLVTKTAGERPTASLYFGQGYTPIASGALVEEVAGALGKRFGAGKRLGVLVSGSYDYNGRKTYDLEPVPGVLPDNITPTYPNAEIRQYEFTRHRYGFGGSADYKFSDNSSIYVRSLYSIFKDFGRRYDYVLGTNPVLDGVSNTNLSGYNSEARLSDFLVSSLSVGGLHATSKWLFNWRLAASLSRQLAPINGGESIATFNYAGSTSNCQYDAAATKNVYLPQFSPACFTEVYNPSNLQLSTITDAKYGRAEQLNLEGSGSVARNYHLGSHFGTFEFGGGVRNGHKFDDSYEYDYTAIDPTKLPATLFLTNKTSPNYYDGAYKYGPFISWDKALAFLRANPGAFTVTNTLGGNPANFDLIERVSAGYLMNSLDFGRFRLIAGVRFEGTQYDTLSTNSSNVNPCSGLCVKNPGSYVDVLPSASLTMRLNQNSDLRFAFGKGLARPDPTALSTAVSLDTTTAPPTYTIGNPLLKPEHAYDYDVLYERSLQPLGLVRGGFFYKSLSDPFVQLLTKGTGPYAGSNILQPANGGSGYIAGVELDFDHHFTYLPGLLNGLGFSGNYSYATSQANNVNPGNRTDSPALLRQAPNTWNLSPTYDRGRLSVRLGLAYNGSNIYAYQFVDGAPLGKTGPLGDQYLYSHFQVDMQGSFRLGKGLTAIASAQNLNNAINGLYNGSPQFVLQREMFHATYLGGIRWDLTHD